MYANLNRAAAAKRPPRRGTLKYGPWPGGIVTAKQGEQLKPSELMEALNFFLTGDGTAVTRDGTTLVSTIAGGGTVDIIQADDCKIGTTWYTIFAGDNNILYRDNSGTATAIGTCEGDPRFLPFVGVLLIFDGSYIKYWTGSGDIKIAYDNGTDTASGFQFNNRLGTAGTSLALGNGTNVRVAYKFTSQNWTAGYTIPPTNLYAKLKKEGTGGTGAITARIRKQSDNSIMAAKTFLADVTTLTGNYVEYDITFEAADITTELSPNVAYYASLEYAGGDAGNYVHVGCSVVSSGGVAAVYVAAWANDTAKNPVMGLKPGMPPKAVFGVIHGSRVRCIEGENGTNPSYVWYSAAGDDDNPGYLDWSTVAGTADGVEGGGFNAVVDESATNFPIGAIASFYGDLYVWGTKRQPFFAKLTGTTPNDYKYVHTLQQVSGNYTNTVVAPDDVISLHPGGVSFLSTMQEYGDIQAVTSSDAITNVIRENYSDSAVAGYDPENGLYLLKLPAYDYTIVFHTRLKYIRPLGQKQVAVSPITMWDFAFPEAPTCFGHGNGYTLIGTDGGKLYRMNSTAYEDADTAITYKLWPHYQITSRGELAARSFSWDALGKYGGTFNVKFCRNASRDSFLTKAVQLTYDSSQGWYDFDDLAWWDALMAWDPQTYYNRTYINFNCRQLLPKIEDVVPYGAPISFRQLLIEVDRIAGGL